MATRFPKPWFREDRGLWYATIGGKQFNLGLKRDEAFDKYYRLMAMPQDQRLTGETIAEILDAFLDWCQRHRRPATFEWYRGRLQEFLDTLPRRLHVSHLKPFHLQRFIDAHPEWAPGNKRNACRAVQRPLAWAVQQGYIDRSPLAYFEKPPAGTRNQIVSDEEYQPILANTRDSAFKDLVQTAYLTGARPQEILRVETRHADLPNRRWIFPPEEAKGGKSHRIIYLDDVTLSLTQKLTAKHKRGPIFRNSRGKPWTTDAVNCRFATLQKKLGVRYCLYILRHTWATNALRKGVDPITVSTLLGHADTNQLARTYAKLSQDPNYLQHAVARVAAR